MHLTSEAVLAVTVYGIVEHVSPYSDMHRDSAKSCNQRNHQMFTGTQQHINAAICLHILPAWQLAH